MDVSGIPNLGFGGGSIFGGQPNVAPAMSADQINSSIWGRYSPQAAQSTLSNIYGGGGFGALPSYYSNLGAAFGRSTGGFDRNALASLMYSGGGIGSDSRYGSPYSSGYVSPMSRLAPAGRGDPYFMNSDPAGFNPSPQGGIGSDMRYGSQNYTPGGQNFNDLWKSRIAPQLPPMPPSTVTVPGQQGSADPRQFWYGGVPTASS